jgi:NAD-specific glutamate dehydrogenase
VDGEARNALLVEMTDEVSALVLADNRTQNAVPASAGETRRTT